MKISSSIAVASPSLCLALIVGRSAATAADAGDSTYLGGRSSLQQVRGVVRGQQRTSRSNDPGSTSTLVRELMPKRMKGMIECGDKKMMTMRHKKGVRDCPRITPAPTKRPARHVPTGHPSAKPVGTPSPTQRPSTQTPTRMPSTQKPSTDKPSSQPSDQPSPRPPDFCRDYTVLFDGNGHRYYSSYPNPWNYHTAMAAQGALQTCCGGKVPHVVTITNDSESNFIDGRVVPAGTTIWLGLDDRGHNGTYEWVNGENVTYRSNLVSQYPAGMCVTSTSGNWITRNCSELYIGVLEYECDAA